MYVSNRMIAMPYSHIEQRLLSRCVVSCYRNSLVTRAYEKSRNLCWLQLFFLRVQAPGNTLTPCIFSVTFDSVGELLLRVVEGIPDS